MKLLFETAIMAALAQASSLRDLRVTLTTASGRACRSNCLDQGLFFCGLADRSEGFCCDDETSCRQSDTEVCTFDMASDGSSYVLSQYQACPFVADVCGENRVVSPATDTEVTMTSRDNPDSSDFIFGQLCAYEVQWPEGSVEEDKIFVIADELDDAAQVYASYGLDDLYSNTILNEVEL